MEKQGTKELQEALVGFIALAALMAEHFKDGIQVSDVGPIMSKLQEPEMKEKLMAAYNGVDKVGSEAKDLELVEVLALLPAMLPEIDHLIKAIRK